eukprot:TRINITY_DN5155_c0_g1_i4.p1 TRINITY_DN5155_c0_g1~~TRINITY_DN5155_c0_g1_i4.p1  ORF type:complete len:314 (+),score=62.57 TRINITY_DN5155_c0_g1_i4:51-992(+)
MTVLGCLPMMLSVAVAMSDNAADLSAVGFGVPMNVEAKVCRGLRKNSKWCCAMYGVGCEAERYRCQNAESLDQVEWCCKEKDIGCFVDCKKPDLQAWDNDYCCRVKGVHCAADRLTYEVPNTPGFRFNARLDAKDFDVNPRKTVRHLRMSILAASATLREGGLGGFVITNVGGLDIPSEWNHDEASVEQSVMHAEYVPENGSIPVSHYAMPREALQVIEVTMYVVHPNQASVEEVHFALQDAIANPDAVLRSHQRGYGVPLQVTNVVFIPTKTAQGSGSILGCVDTPLGLGIIAGISVVVNICISWMKRQAAC